MFLFPGQGSQELGMGQAFHDVSPEVQALYAKAAEIAELPVKDLCFEGPIETLTETGNLQPCMTVTVLACLHMVEQAGLTADMVAGHSLGEYAALAAAGVINKEDCLQLVTARGRLMQREAEANPGAMGAVMMMEPEVVEELVNNTAGADHIICLANYNAPKQLVVSGSKEGIAALETLVKEKRGRFRALPVSGAWHSPLMNGAADEFAGIIERVTFHDAKVPVVLNVTGTPEVDGGVIKETMKQQMCSGVRWYPGILHAWDEGVRTFTEIGPKAVLSGMLRKIVPAPGEMTVHKIKDPETLEAAQA
ncbi:MAG: ACP S-malonyltransferase [Acidobacteriota bacterium]|nr:ACP S-malonyltransferase [Acidobacteriota bacterium]